MIYTDAKGSGGQYTYCFCRNRKKGTCDLPYLPTWAVEDHVSDFHAGLTLDRAFFDDVLQLIEEALSDEKASTRQLHERLERGLARLDVKEERLIDLAADGELPMDKIKQRIASIATERIRIRSELAKSGSQLSVRAEALRLAIGLLRDLPGIYGQHGAEVRQAINDALFTRLYIDQDVTRVIWQDEAAEIYAAAQEASRGSTEVAGRGATGANAKRDAETSRFANLDRRTPGLRGGNLPRELEYGRHGGGRGIRTHDAVADIAVFKTAALGHYASPPRAA